MKDGTTHLAYKPEHAVDLDTGAVVAAEIHPADEGDTTTLSGTLQAAAANLAKVDRAPSTTETAELVADKGYHSRAVLKDLDGGVWKTRIAEPQRTALLRWHGDTEARDAVYANRNRLRSAVGKAAMRRRAEIVERSFAHNLERGGMRRTWLRGRENVHKRYLIHVAGHNLGILMRLLIGAGTPKEAAARGRAFLFVAHGDTPWRSSSSPSTKPAAASSSSPSPPSRHDHNSHIVNGLIKHSITGLGGLAQATGGGNVADGRDLALVSSGTLKGNRRRSSGHRTAPRR